MTIKINISKNLNNNFVQVDVETKNTPKRSFKVPEANADKFCNAYKQYNKEETIFSSIRVMAPILLVTGLSNYFGKNLGNTWRWLLGLGSGIITSIGAVYLNTNILLKKEAKLLNQYNAEEIFQKTAKLDFLEKTK